MLKVKRVYEKKETADGKRILIDRVWPRGLTSEAAAVDEWLKELAPSTELRKWFSHDPEKWEEFRRRYTEELSSPEKMEVLERIARTASSANVTILFGSKETRYNNARVIEELLHKLMKDKVGVS
jgi:uncharacterized protein YeaO (DUF488 family)